jgi:hypothetical protein
MARSPHKYHFIYKTTNIKNGRFYIGMHSTSNLNDGYLGSGDRLRRSIRRHGKENFKLEILEFFNSREKLAEREKQLVNEDLLKDPMCMNLKPGGSGGFVNEDHQKKATKQANIKRLELLKDNDYKSEFYKKTVTPNRILILKNLYKEGVILKNNFTNKKHTKESKIRIGLANSQNQRGEKNSQYGTRWITNGIKNKKIKTEDIIPKGWVIGRIIKKLS